MRSTEDPTSASAPPVPQLRTDDADLVSDVAAVLSVPREQPADSFVLHAPLELLARTVLLPLVSDRDREAARDRLDALARRFEASGPGLDAPPPPVDAFPSVDDAVARLTAVLAAGDLDEVDRTAWWLADATDAAGADGVRRLRSALAGPALTSLAAAGHAPIFLHLFPRVAATGAGTARPVRGLLREMARHPEWQLRWIDAVPAAATTATDDLEAALSDAVARGPVGSDFIQPTMDRVDSTGVAAAVLGPITGAPAPRDARMVLRVAARSMLFDRHDAAPYGWTHCLTMPQAVLALSDVVAPVRALRVAATEVLGFRSSLGARPVPVALLDEGGGAEVPANPGLELEEALRADRATAAGAVWHTGAGRGEVGAALASAASRHDDAHLVKYTAACLDAARWDPTAARLHLSAAASLVGWWAETDRATAGQDVARYR